MALSTVKCRMLTLRPTKLDSSPGVRNPDSKSGANTQQRFKEARTPIRLLQISISQSPLGDFCNTICICGRLRVGKDNLHVAGDQRLPIRSPDLVTLPDCREAHQTYRLRLARDLEAT